MRPREFWLVVLTVLALLLISLGCSCQAEPPRVEAAPEPQARLAKVAFWGEWSDSLTVICDRETGNLVYVSATANGGGVAVVPGGCK